ncbi:MAG: esterase [Bacteroidetes bacterium]|nr:MAG: esterase [Bacteroidota bacterium]
MKTCYLTKNRLYLFFLLTLIAIQSISQNLKIVKTGSGEISGIESDHGVHIFKGIPFAAAPLGDLRWKAPQPVAPWTGVRLCTAFGPSPMQGKPIPFGMWTREFLIPKEPISEDCLYLNVWTAAQSPKERRPVIVWIYGGGFVSGGSACPIYDGEAMARKGIVFVSINYRVGIFGFFAHPELTRESGKNASGNYALMDQLAALQWVQKNIAAFGGDPINVTVAGQSAGSFCVNSLVASPLAKNLFHKAIGESGASFSVSFPTLQEAEEEGLSIASFLHAPSLADLRKLPAEEILKAPIKVRGPIVDGYVLPQSVADIFAAGAENKVPLLTGWNEDEGFSNAKKAEDFKKEIEHTYGNDANQFLKYYPASSDSIAAVSQLNLSRDQTFGSQNYAWAVLQSRQLAQVFVYRFARKLPAGKSPFAHHSAFHTGEVPYAYNNLGLVDRPWEPVDYKLAEIMSSYWANFVATGDPNGNGLPTWPAFNSREKKVMILKERSEAVTLPDADALDFLYKKLK